MPLGISFPLDEREPRVLMRFDSLQDYQRAVGGYVEAISVGLDGMAFLGHDEAKLMGTPMNRRATLFWWLHQPPARQVDCINGPAVLIGPDTEDGETRDVPKSTWMLLFSTGKTFGVELQVVDSPKWHRNEADFDDFFEAALWAIELCMHRR
ncbi:DUF3846 domain-containing protein [Nocardioides sp. Soil777]|uniref:DUF3846 domain-containing protein n=1 Tax=Nocardioides sp. Soil777 TaxID=1736409 RepID=UPI000A9D910D|nr:DUF3846 domain-containing protein [Nocardioides sp. Soil777]